MLHLGNWRKWGATERVSEFDTIVTRKEEGGATLKEWRKRDELSTPSQSLASDPTRIKVLLILGWNPLGREGPAERACSTTGTAWESSSWFGLIK